LDQGCSSLFLGKTSRYYAFEVLCFVFTHCRILGSHAC
jgi:hypothetical protein